MQPHVSVWLCRVGPSCLWFPSKTKQEEQGDLLVVTLQPCLSRCINSLVTAIPILSLRWSIWGVSLSNNLSLILLPSSQPQFPVSLPSVKVFQSNNCPPPVRLSMSRSLSMSSLPFPCLQSMMKYGCQHDSLFPDCVRTGTLTHT